MDEFPYDRARRRLGSLVRVRLVVLILAGALVGCSSVAHRATPPAPIAPGPLPSAPTTSPTGAARTDAPAPATTTATLPTTVRLPPTTAHPPPPPLPAPRALEPLVAPGLPGEGVWQAAGGARLGRGYGVYTTQLRAAPGLPPAGVAWVNPAATRIALYAGTAEPYGVWPRQGAVGAADQRMLLAAFNGGFRIYAYDTGWYDAGPDGGADAGRRGLPRHVRQRHCDRGRLGTRCREWPGRGGRAPEPHPAGRPRRRRLQRRHPVRLGRRRGGGSSTWRSAVGVTAGGDLVYVGGPSLRPCVSRPPADRRRRSARHGAGHQPQSGSPSPPSSTPEESPAAASSAPTTSWAACTPRPLTTFSPSRGTSSPSSPADPRSRTSGFARLPRPTVSGQEPLSAGPARPTSPGSPSPGWAW